MERNIPKSILSIVDAKQIKGEKLTTLTCRMSGHFRPNTPSIIFPAEKKFQVKSVEKEDDNLYKVKVKGIPFKDCKPFSIIAAQDQKVRYSNKGYFIPAEFHSKEFFPGEYVVTGGIFKGYRPFNRDKHKARLHKIENIYGVSFPFKLPMIPGTTFTFENSEGRIRDMVLIYPGDLGKKDENILSGRMDKFRSMPSIKAIYSMILRTDLFIDLPFFIKDEEFEGSLKFGTVRVMQKEYETLKNKIIKQSKASGGVSFIDLKKSCNTSQPLFFAVFNQLVEESVITKFDEYIVYNGESMESYLSPLTKIIYKKIVEAGSEGISSRSEKDFDKLNCYNEIKRMGLAVVLDDDLYISQDGYKELVGNIFKGLKVNDNLTIQYIRDVTGLSRRFIISLLKIFEATDIIERRDDDERVILQIP